MAEDTLDPARLIQLALEDDVEFSRQPQRLDGGRSAELFRFRISGGPDDLVDIELVLRVLPVRGSMVEWVFQATLAEAGFPTPRVLRHGSYGDDAQLLMVMEWVPGRPLPQALGLRRTLTDAPSRLAQLMVSLHRIEPTDIVNRTTMEAAAVQLDITGRALLEIDRAGSIVSSPGYHEVMGWLEANRPAPTGPVLCHGDIHPLNVLNDGGSDMLLDWELSGLAGPEFDVARTKLVVSAVPMTLPTIARRPIERIGARLAARFETAYLQHLDLEPAALRWYEVLHATRIAGMILVSQATPGQSSQVAETWSQTLPSLIGRIERSTGFVVWP